MASRSIKKKVTLLGDPGVGKTSLIQRFVFDAFDDKYLATIGAKITKKIYHCSEDAELPLSDGSELCLLIWDIAGQKAFQSVHQAYYRGAEGALVVCDITQRESLTNVVEWVTELYNVVGNVPVIILVNKFDLQDRVAFGEEEIKEVLSTLPINYAFTSAKTGHNVALAFKELSKLLLLPH